MNYLEIELIGTYIDIFKIQNVIKIAFFIYIYITKTIFKNNVSLNILSFSVLLDIVYVVLVYMIQSTYFRPRVHYSEFLR